MKLIFAILLLSLSMTAFSKVSINRIKKDNLNHYKVLVMGDIGQVEEFRANLISSKETLEKSKLYSKGIQCDPKKLTMPNFLKVLNKAKTLSGIDESVILGDALYTEANYIGKLFTNPSDKEDKELMNSEFSGRLDCGWKLLKNILKDQTLPDFLKNKLTIIFGNHSLDVDYSVELNRLLNFQPSQSIFGNDIIEDNDKELPQLEKIIKTVNELPEHEINLLKPRVTKGSGKGISDKIYYLDIDISKLVCSHIIENNKNDSSNLQSDFDKCLNKNKYDGYPSMATDQQKKETLIMMTKYYEELVKIINLLTKNKDAIWKIVRLHQPIFNLEIDFYGVKSNTYLMNLFKLAGIHLWFVSHFHASEVNIGRYENSNYKYLFNDKTPDVKREESKYGGKKVNTAVDLQTPDKCHNALTDYIYVPKDPNDLTKVTIPVDTTGKKMLNPKCINRCIALLKGCDSNVGTIYIKKSNNDMILQILSGNGGRKLDSVLSDKFSDSYLLFAKAAVGEYGFFTADFDETSVTIEFYSDDKLNFTLRVIQDDSKATDDANFKVDLNKLLNTKYLTLPNVSTSAAKFLKKR